MCITGAWCSWTYIKVYKVTYNVMWVYLYICCLGTINSRCIYEYIMANTIRLQEQPVVLFLAFSTAPDRIALLYSKLPPTDITHSSDIWPVTGAEMRTEEILTFSTTSPSPTYLTTAPWVKTKWSDSGSKWQFSGKERKSQSPKQGMKKRTRLMHWLNARSPRRLAFTTAYSSFEPLVGADSVRTLTAKKGRGRGCDGNSQWNNQHMFDAPRHGARKQRE